MKKTILIPILLLLSVASVTGQTRDSVSAPRTEFKDRNADGVPDRRDGKGVRTSDRFIDRNGDGISDGRERGLGFSRAVRGTAAGTGKQGHNERKGHR